MKKLTALWMIVLMLVVSIPAMGAMSMSEVRQNARFLTDRMAHELNLTSMQYDDVYEVNYDFIDNVRHIMDDVVCGHGHATDRYYEFLDYRNDDLRWILSASQYRRFMNVEYFYRPIYTTGNNWLFRIYQVYSDIHHFYFDKPHHYATYKGGHYRTRFGNVSYYKNHRKEHYKHDFYKGDVHVHRHPSLHAPKPAPAPKADKPAASRPRKESSSTSRQAVRKVDKSGDRTANRPASHAGAREKQREKPQNGRGK